MNMDNSPAIAIENLSKTYKGKKRAQVEALKGMSLTVDQGEIFGFLGPNGAGKSTTIKCLVGLIQPTSGSARIKGIPVTQVESRRSMGYLPENPAFYDYLSAEEYLTFVGRTYRMSADQLTTRCREVLRQLELWDARKRPMRGYSKGMVQRVGLAQTLIHDPDVYILDEPMSGLDPIGRALVKEIIIDLKRRGKSVFFSTHITDDVEKVCDQVGVIVQGTLVAVDRVETILRSGVEGYQVHLRTPAGEPAAVIAGITPDRSNGPLAEYAVPCARFNAFMEAVNAAGADVALVETKRRDLEDFFLSLVHDHSPHR